MIKVKAAKAPLTALMSLNREKQAHSTVSVAQKQSIASVYVFNSSFLCAVKEPCITTCPDEPYVTKKLRAQHTSRHKFVFFSVYIKYVDICSLKAGQNCNLGWFVRLIMSLIQSLQKVCFLSVDTTHKNKFDASSGNIGGLYVGGMYACMYVEVLVQQLFMLPRKR